MRICIVSGSHRANSQSSKVSSFLQSILENFGATPKIIDLSGNPLPLWDEGIWKNDNHWSDLWNPIAKELRDSDGFVFVVPEWAGMVPSGFKNFLLLCGNQELGHKPALIVSLSASCNGAYPVAELRMTSSKNNHLVYIPDHVIIRHVKNVLNSEPAEGEQHIRDRLSYSISVLCGYAKCLGDFRKSFEVDFEKYGYGM